MNLCSPAVLHVGLSTTEDLTSATRVLVDAQTTLPKGEHDAKTLRLRYFRAKDFNDLE